MGRTTWRAVAVAVLGVFLAVAGNQVLNNNRLVWTWLVVAIVIAVVVALMTARPDKQAAQSPDPDSGGSDRRLHALAVAVEAVWKPEQRRRRLLNPHPLPTAWITIGPPIADHWANIRADGLHEPLDLAGAVDLEHPDAFHQIVTNPRLRGRVVLLGDPGAGKTALLLRLTLTLLATREQGGLIPVLLRLSTWNPGEQNLDTWIASRLDLDYGYRQPVPAGRLIALLDGFDEMPEERRREALLAIGNTFTDGPLVLTSRTPEYLDALTALADNTLAAAAVLELTALPASTVRDYLQLTTARPTDWADVFALDATQGGRVAAALAAPLWVDLARSTYSDPDRVDNNPRELLRLPSADAIHGQLLDRLIPTAYPEPAEPGTNGHVWRRHDAQRWLSRLALDMRRRGTQDIAWWALILSSSHPLRVILPFVAWMVCGLATAFVINLGYRATDTAAGLVVGFGLGLTTAALGPPPRPSRGARRRRRTGVSAIRRLLQTLGIGLAVWGAAGIPATLGALATGAATAPALATMFIFLFGMSLTFAFVREYTTIFDRGDADVQTSTSPEGLLRTDRRLLVWLVVVCLLLGNLVTPFMDTPVLGPSFGLLAGLAAGLMVCAWGWYVLARVWWWSRGWLPWRVMEFLADAHRRGVLRQAGGVWQFRHALLRDRLAAAADDGRMVTERTELATAAD
ncbi:NACHT domain-containing protein [Dactylosporangium sp. NPDC051541]|uniref:NACHT domain-containing protein n=1 Tax=Dactylosporangium sp. NPDC051541 TaxID=3363977 RepID=UPI0037997869